MFLLPDHHMVDQVDHKRITTSWMLNQAKDLNSKKMMETLWDSKTKLLVFKNFYLQITIITWDLLNLKKMLMEAPLVSSNKSQECKNFCLQIMDIKWDLLNLIKKIQLVKLDMMRRFKLLSNQTLFMETMIRTMTADN